MSTFLLTFFTVYGSLQAYFYYRVHAAFRPKGWPRAALAAFLLLMVAGPFLVRQLDKADWFRTAQVAALVAYTWMVVSMWVFCFGVPLDAWNGALWAVARQWPAAARLRLPPKAAAYALGALVAGLAAWGAVEARMVRLNEFSLRTPLLPPGSPPVRIVHLTDVHLGLIVRHRRLERILGAVRRAEPDIVAATGDIVDNTGSHMEDLIAPLAALEAPLGKFAVLGNHEYYAGLGMSLEFYERAGFRVLRGESVLVDGRIRLAGVDDPAGAYQGLELHLDEDAALPPAPPQEFTVLLKHRPQVRPESIPRFHLQLSGHSHGGQVFPFTLFVRMEHGRKTSGMFRMAEDTWAYVSRGAGTWGAPLRVLARPDVALFVVEPEEGTAGRRQVAVPQVPSGPQ